MPGKKEENMETTADMGGSSVETKSSRTPATSSAASPPPTASAPAPIAVSEPSEPADDYGTALLSFSTSTQTLSSIDPFSTIPEWETGKRYQEMFDRARKDADEVYKKLLDYMDKRANEKRGTGGEKGGKGEEEEKVAKSEASIAQPSSPSSEPPKSDDAPSTDSKTTCGPSACPSSPPADNEATEEKTEKKDKGKQGVTDKPKTEDTTAAAPAAPTEPTALSIDGEEKKGKQAENKEKK